MTDYMTVLRQEFEGAPGAFLTRLRADLVWDKDAFLRMATAMRTCCETDTAQVRVERWVARGYWFVTWYAGTWTEHPNFPRVYAPEYYQTAFELLHMLAYYFFFAESPFSEPAGLDELFERLKAS